jgi:hypothetical protein
MRLAQVPSRHICRDRDAVWDTIRVGDLWRPGVRDHEEIVTHPDLADPSIVEVDATHGRSRLDYRTHS